MRFRLPSLRQALAAIALGTLAGNLIAPALHAQEQPAPRDSGPQAEAAAPNLMVLDLRVEYAPGEEVSGIDIGGPTWGRNRKRLPNPKAHGFEGVRIIGHGVGQTILGGEPCAQRIKIADGCGRIEIEGLTLYPGDTHGIHYGSARGEFDVEPVYDDQGRPVLDDDGDQVLDVTYDLHRDEHYTDSMLVLEHVDLRTKPRFLGHDSEGEPIYAPISTKWMVHTVNVDHLWRHVTADAPHTAEHLLYAHGFARRGIFWDDVHVARIGAEILKVATRAWEAHYAPNAMILVLNSSLAGWHQPWSHRGGGGIVLQGPAAHLVVKRTVFEAPHGKGAAIMFDDGLSWGQPAENNLRRAYVLPSGDEIGVGVPVQATMGHVLLDQVAIYAAGSNREMIRSGTIAQGYPAMGVPRHNVMRSFTMKNSAVYGGGTINLKLVEGDRVRLVNNNAPGAEAFVRDELGWDTTAGAVAHTPVGSGPIEEDRP